MRGTPVPWAVVETVREGTRAPCSCHRGSGAQLRYICSRSHVHATELWRDFTHCTRLWNAPIGAKRRCTWQKSRAQRRPRRPGSCNARARRPGFDARPGSQAWSTRYRHRARQDAPPVHDLEGAKGWRPGRLPAIGWIDRRSWSVSRAFPRGQLRVRTEWGDEAYGMVNAERLAIACSPASCITKFG